MKKSIVLSLLIILTANTYCQETNNGDKEKLAESIAKKSNYYALIIGNNQYQDQLFLDLDNPILFAEKLYSTLNSSYNFKTENIRLLKNATKAEFIMTFDELVKRVTSEDNLLIFYAGQGLWDEEERIGYWIPSDARKSSKGNWFPDSLLINYIRRINSKNTLLIVDASYSGSIFKSRSMFNSNKDLTELYEQPSRKAMTSCTLTEATDDGIFFEYLLRSLNENRESLVSSEQLFSSLRNAVINNSNSIPQYGTISDTGDKGGDFIFIKSK